MMFSMMISAMLAVIWALILLLLFTMMAALFFMDYLSGKIEGYSEELTNKFFEDVSHYYGSFFLTITSLIAAIS